MFFFIKAWQLIFLIGSYSLFFDPQKKYFAGITAGLTVHMMMRSKFI
jgi:hypothetical protein